jgi:rubrerythrin
MSALALLSHDEARFELRCAKCGYGVVVRIAPDTCPMCRATVWGHVEPAPDDAERKADRSH